VATDGFGSRVLLVVDVAAPKTSQSHGAYSALVGSETTSATLIRRRRLKRRYRRQGLVGVPKLHRDRPESPME